MKIPAEFVDSAQFQKLRPTAVKLLLVLARRADERGRVEAPWRVACDAAGIEPSTFYRNLRALEGLGVLKRRRRGRAVAAYRIDFSDLRRFKRS